MSTLHASALMIVVASALSSLACFESNEEGWENYAGLESPPLELAAGDTNAGHFTVVRRNVPRHTTLLNIDVSLSFDGPDPLAARVTVVADVPPDPWGFRGAGIDFWLAPRVENAPYANKTSSPGSCEQCIDSFSVVVERLSDVTEGTVTAQWNVALWANGEGETLRDMELEILYDP